MKRILITSPIPEEGIALLKKKYKIHYPTEALKRNELLELIPHFEGLLCMLSDRIDQEVIDAGTHLEVICDYAVGYNNIDIQYAASNGIAVCNTPLSVCEPTAEHAMGLVVASVRRIAEQHHRLQNKERIPWGMMDNIGHTLWNKTLGIVGMGRIGKAIARRALSFGMNIIYYSRTPLLEDEALKYQASYCSLEELLQKSDVVSLNVPLLPETTHLMNKERFAMMKQGAYLVNTARGKVVDEQALVDALLSGHLGGAAADVFEHEPKIHPALLDIPNMLLTPHIGTTTWETRYDMGIECAENFVSFWETKEAMNVVNGVVPHNPLLSTFTFVPFDKIQNKHYLPAYRVALAQGKQAIQAIIDCKNIPTFENTIEALEYAGKRISMINNILFNLNCAETNDELQEIVEEVSPLLTAYENDIVLNASLFKRIKDVYHGSHSSLSSEQEQLLEQTYKAFIRGGANLSDQDKTKYRAITEELSLAQIKFGRNVLDENNNFELLVSNLNDIEGLPASNLDAAKLLASKKNKEGWLFNLSAPSYVPFMKYVKNRALRKAMYLAYNSKCFKNDVLDNQTNIKQITELRIQESQLLGYKNYADFVLEKRMAKNLDEVYQFLHHLLAAYKPVAEKEFEEVNKLAHHQGLEGSIEAWDWSFYAEKLKQKQFSFSEEETKPYFELKNVVSGIFGLATTLYGIRFVEKKDIPVYHEEVTAYEVLDNDQDLLGIFYTDFHPRESKQGGAWMTNYMEQEEHQRPHVSIVMNFTRPTSSSPALLSFSEVNTFLHEFGHALHGLFANTKYASLSGTNVYRDFVELPSQLMENWATEKQFLDSFAIHYETEALIPQELVAKMKASENFLVGNQCLRQLNFGFLDLAWHSLTKPYQENMLKLEKQIGAYTQILPPVENTSISAQFSHIFAGGYAAGYYSYKWAEVLDADIFSVFKENGIFNSSIANKFRREVLEQGGTKDPMILYKNFRGQAPTIDALLIRNGIESF